MIKYKSTRGSERRLSAASAIIAGIAEDKGLYVPESVPALPMDIEDMQKMNYKEIAYTIIRSFFDDYTDEEMKACVDGAYDGKFEADDVVPIVKAGDAYFLELYHGRTAAFKDMALSILPYLLTTAVKKENEEAKICILTATSGDTGKAALEGFADVPGTEIIVFFPDKGVSEVQKRQMVSQEGANTHVFAINGNFDDAQTGVKKIFNDDAFAEKLAEAGCRLSSANSINIGRLIPQVAYYVYGYAKLAERGAIKTGDPINVVVPTGNFGNILAAYYAKQMGVPIGKLICASNENKVLFDFFQTGTYDKNREFVLTTSPSMDILTSSNLERLIYVIAGEDSDKTKELMEALKKDGTYTVSEDMKAKLSDFAAGYATEDETAEQIHDVYDKTGYVMDTHTAVASYVCSRYEQSEKTGKKYLIASTASPYKFVKSVMTAIDAKYAEEDEFALLPKLQELSQVGMPQAIKDILDANVLHNIECDVDQMEETVKQILNR